VALLLVLPGVKATRNNPLEDRAVEYSRRMDMQGNLRYSILPFTPDANIRVSMNRGRVKYSASLLSIYERVRYNLLEPISLWSSETLRGNWSDYALLATQRSTLFLIGLYMDIIFDRQSVNCKD